MLPGDYDFEFFRVSIFFTHFKISRRPRFRSLREVGTIPVHNAW